MKVLIACMNSSKKDRQFSRVKPRLIASTLNFFSFHGWGILLSVYILGWQLVYVYPGRLSTIIGRI
jgi:hypothetical protein